MKKFYVFLAFFAFLAFAGTAFAARPVVNLHPASNIAQTSATLSLSYNSSLPVSVVMFEYTTDASFGSNVVTRSGSATSINITGLTPNTTYYYRAMVSNSDGPTTEPVSGSYNFQTTGYSTSYVDTLGETNITASSLTLNGRANTYGASGTYYFRYYNAGCSSLIANTPTGTLSATTGTQNVSASISGLSANTTYCAELVATINGTTYTGGKVSVKTSNTGGGGTGSCVINNFYATPSTVTYGSSATLVWNTINCTNASLTSYGSVNTNGSQNVSPSGTTTYTLNAYGTVGSDSKLVTITVTNNNNNPGGYYPIPSCYYNSTCYWNGSTWTYSNNNNNPGNNTPACYYSGTCYWNGSTWVNYNNTTNPTTYPACYYNATCYWSGSTWITVPNGGTTTGNNYYYNPHNPYTGGPNYVYKTLPPVVNTVYVDQPVNTTTQVIPFGGYVGYDYSTDIMNRLSMHDYPTTRNLLTASAGSAWNVSLITLLLALIIIAAIVYVVRSRSEDRTH